VEWTTFVIHIIDLRGIVGAPQEWVARGDRISDPRGGCGTMRNRQAMEKTPAAKKIMRGCIYQHVCVCVRVCVRIYMHTCLNIDRMHI